MRLPYYGRNVDDDRFPGRLGTVVRLLNRTRAFVQRQAEVFTAMALAREQDVPVRRVAERCVDEGLLSPIEILARGPVEPTDPPDTPGVNDQRWYRGRDYSARVGRSRERIERQETAGTIADRTMSLFARYGGRRVARANRYGLPPTWHEDFEPVEK